MDATVTMLIIALATFLVTTLVNAFVFGMFLGGMRTEMRLMSDRLAKIEGVFTLVPRGMKDVGTSLSMGVVCLDWLDNSL